MAALGEPWTVLAAEGLAAARALCRSRSLLTGGRPSEAMLSRRDSTCDAAPTGAEREAPLPRQPLQPRGRGGETPELSPVGDVGFAPLEAGEAAAPAVVASGEQSV